MSAPVQISAWYTSRPKLITAYIAPELAGIAVAGTVHGHPRKPDGSRVTTTRVVRVEGRKFWTESGTAYELVGEPDPRFLVYLAVSGRTYDAEQPIRVVGGAK